jgi:hypothetical protein
MSARNAHLPQLRHTDTGARLIVDGRPFIILGGEIHNSSAASGEYLEQHVWEVRGRVQHRHHRSGADRADRRRVRLQLGGRRDRG